MVATSFYKRLTSIDNIKQCHSPEEQNLEMTEFEDDHNHNNHHYQS
jgi:hypothetical protein